MSAAGELTDLTNPSSKLKKIQQSERCGRKKVSTKCDSNEQNFSVRLNFRKSSN